MQAAVGSTPSRHPPVLVAASKTQPAERVATLIHAGVQDIGENRVQEAMAKRPAVERHGAHARWHLIGPLQSNKAREAVGVFEVIHTIDRPKIVHAVADAAEQAGKIIECFVQVNIGREAQKHGVEIEDLQTLIASVRARPNLRLLGLMAVPPADVPPAPYFALLAELARREKLDGLSMGMSGDFEMALRLGATHVRIGTALFGPRGN